MAQDIEGLIPDGAKKDLEQIDDLWADILAKTIAYVDTVSKLNTTNGVDRTLSSLEDGVNGLSDAYKQYVQGLDDVTAAQKRAADAALKAAKAKTEESKQALNNAKAQKEEAKAHETTSKSKDRAAKESAKIDAAKRKELQALINDTKKAFTEIDKIQKQYQDNQKKYGAEEIKRQAKEENWSYAQRVAALKAFVAEQKKIVAESDQRIKAIDREIAALDKETNKELDALRKKNTAYNILSETHKRLKIDAQNAGAEFGIESKQFKEAAASANVLDRQLKEIDGQLGDHRRNVGNYASAWSGLNRSIGIVLTELPNAGLSWRTFAISISNNIGQVVEDMNTMVAANRAAAAAGQATIPVWKQVASAIFSWRTLLYVGIAVFTAISAQAGEATDKIKIFTKESDALKDVNTRVSDSYHKQAAELRILKDRFQDATASVEQKQDVIRQLNKTYGDTIGKIDSINEAEKFFIERSGAYVEALLVRAQIEGAYDAIAENSKKVLAQQAKDADEATNIWTKFSTYLYSFDKANPLFKKDGDKKWAEEYNKQLEGIRRRMLANTENDAAQSNSIIETFIQKQITKLNELSKKFGFGFDQDPKLKQDTSILDEQRRQERLRELRLRFREETKKFVQEEMNALAKLSAENPALGAAISELEINLKGQEGVTRDRLKAIERLYAEGAISFKEYEKRKTAVTDEEANNRLLTEIKFLKKILDLAPLEVETRMKYKEQLAKAELELLEKTNKAKEEKEKASIERRKQIEKELKDYRKTLSDELVRATVDVGNIILRQEEKGLRSRRQELDRKKELSDAEIEVETAKQQSIAIASATSEEERQAALVKIQEDAAAKKLSAEQNFQAAQAALQAKQEEIERKRFMLQQAAAIADVLMKMKQEAAKVQLEAAALASNPITAPLAALKLAALPYIYGTGAAAAAILAAQTFFYAEGTPEDGHPGGAAVIGEGGQPEFVKEQGKDGYWVDRATYFPSLPKGTDVIPMDRFLGPNLQDGGATTVINQMYDMRSHLKAIERAVKNIPATDIRIEGGAFKKSIRTGNFKTNYIRKHII